MVKLGLGRLLVSTGLQAPRQESAGLAVTTFPGPELGHGMVGLGRPLPLKPVQDVHSSLLRVPLERRDPLSHLLGEDKNTLQSHKKVFLAGPVLLASCHDRLHSFDA